MIDHLVALASSVKRRSGGRKGSKLRHLAFLLLHDKHHLTLPQIASLTGASYAMVKNGISKARAKLEYDPTWKAELEALQTP